MTDTPEDIERERFLMRLLRSHVQITAWEADFAISALECGQTVEFTERQREKIDQLRRIYERLL